MQVASFPGFIKTLFYIIAFYYIFNFWQNYFCLYLLKKVVEKAGENFKQQQQRQHQEFMANKIKTIILSFTILKMLKNLEKPKK